jgi:hypothetical protein
MAMLNNQRVMAQNSSKKTGRPTICPTRVMATSSTIDGTYVYYNNQRVILTIINRIITIY